MFSDNKGVETFSRRGRDDLAYYIDKDFAGDDIVNTFLKFGSLFEPVIDCRFAYGFVCLSPTFSVPVWEPEFL